MESWEEITCSKALAKAVADLGLNEIITARSSDGQPSALATWSLAVVSQPT